MPVRKPCGPMPALPFSVSVVGMRADGGWRQPVRRMVVVVGLLALTACTPRALHDTGQAWQRRTCTGIEDVQRRSECLDAASRSYEQDQLTRR